MTMTAIPTTDSTETEALLKSAKNAFYEQSVLTTAHKNQALETFAQLIETRKDFLLQANQKDCDAQQETLSPSLYQRLILTPSKLQQLVQGIRDVVNLTDPIGQTQLKTQLDDGLILDRVSVPLGVIGIIFESRPDVIPQILSLILKSGNVVVLKGGREAQHSNQAFMALVDELNAACPFLNRAWAQLVHSREAVHEILKYPQYVDLIIPRGSNELVQSIMATTQIPVLGHADGVCHQFVHREANLDQALSVVLDSKKQYPAACNALETLLIDAPMAPAFLPLWAKLAEENHIVLKGCSETLKHLPHIEPATDSDWRTEYGDLTLSIRVVEGLEEAIAHINQYGSHHTDGIITESTTAQRQFLAQVDSSSVYVNASTRFADGFRYGFGAEIGISTAKTHARGPVGLEGLVIYKYQLSGHGHVVKDYVGEDAKAFQHKPLKFN